MTKITIAHHLGNIYRDYSYPSIEDAIAGYFDLRSDLHWSFEVALEDAVIDHSLNRVYLASGDVWGVVALGARLDMASSWQRILRGNTGLYAAAKAIEDARIESEPEWTAQEEDEADEAAWRYSMRFEGETASHYDVN